MKERDDNPDAPPTAEDLAEAEALRLALADPSRESAKADFVRSVALAAAPVELSPQAHRAILERSMVRGEVQRTTTAARRKRAAYAIGSALAMAAAIALVAWGGFSRAPELSHAEPLAAARSTQPLFAEPFARVGGESARIDRIASARASDLRDNRFAAWGVR